MSEEKQNHAEQIAIEQERRRNQKEANGLDALYDNWTPARRDALGDILAADLERQLARQKEWIKEST
jgi:FixJ family two-component response regulator